MTQYLKDLIWDECNKANRFLHIPGIYRHFKQTKENEDMIYAVSNISVPITDEDDFQDIFTSPDSSPFVFHHTELEEEIVVIRHKDKYYHHHTVDTEKLVIYTALYGDRSTYVRPLPMFISKVDKEKYPDAVQRYRLELID